MNPDLYAELVKQINSLQKQVDGLIKPEVARWIDWVPTLDQGGAVNVTTTTARYKLKDNTVIMQALLVVSTNGAAGSQISIRSIPALVQPTNFTDNNAIGVMRVTTATLFHVGMLVAVGANDFRMIADGNASRVGATPNFGLLVGDTISFLAVYERA